MNFAKCLNYSDMPKVFLSHRKTDKPTVSLINDYLKNCLIHTWFDKADLSGGDHIYNSLFSAIKECGIFIPVLSENYLESTYCLEELEVAYYENNVRIIPVVLGQKEKIIAKNNEIVNRVIQKFLPIFIDQSEPDGSFREIADAVWSAYPIRFHPIQIKEAGAHFVQMITYDTDSNVPDNCLKDLNLNLRDLISQNSNDGRPIVMNLPVGFSGISINWLVSYLTAAFVNRRDVFWYNTRSKAFICSYVMDPSNSPYSIGDSLSLKI